MLDISTETDASYSPPPAPTQPPCASPDYTPSMESLMSHPQNVMTYTTRPNIRTGFGRPLRKALKMRMKQKRLCKCVVCGERASGMYFGAMVCLPCKSFFIRCTKDGQPHLTCLADKNCNIDRSNRMRCQYCRYQKCLRAGMMRREKPEIVEPGEGQELCHVCADIANGIHFGVMTCEGCKKFFRRALKEADTYECKFQHACALNPRNRNACRLCRYKKCLNVGMSRQAIRMGRPKKVKAEPASIYDAAFAFDQSAALFGDMTMIHPSPVKISHEAVAPPYAHVNNCQLVPHSPCGTDSGIESDRGSPPINSPVASPLQGVTPPLCSPVQAMNRAVFPEHMQANMPTSILDQAIKIEPTDGYENASFYGPSSTSCSNSTISDMVGNYECKQGYASVSLTAEEVKLENSINTVENEPSFDLEDINDILAALGQHFGNLGHTYPYGHDCLTSSVQGHHTADGTLGETNQVSSNFNNPGRYTDSYQQMALSQTTPNHCMPSYGSIYCYQPQMQDFNTMQQTMWQRQQNFMANTPQAGPGHCNTQMPSFPC